MKVLHINQWDNRGGAAIAASRLHTTLLEMGVESQMLVERATGKVPQVTCVENGIRFQVARAAQSAIRRLRKLQKDPSLFACSINLRHNRLVRRINELAPDIVHLHWVGDGVLRIEDLPKIKQPIVWTMHDMWPFCGSEHYNLVPENRWQHAYASELRCKQASGPDLTRWTWRRKMRAWQDVSLTTISPSTWIRDCAATSSLWKDNAGCRHVVIANGLDTTIFCPTPRSQARTELNLPDDGLPLLAFGAFSLQSKVKGGELLLAALRELRKKTAFRIVTFGHGELPQLDSIECITLGSITDPHKLARLYSAADLMLVPSRLESFGQTASEALACATPVTCFDVTGLKDIVDHQINGYRAAPFDVQDFVRGILWCVDPIRRESLQAAARNKVLTHFDRHRIAASHQALYQDILKT